MEDGKIIELFFRREERAIRELSAKYQPYCFKIAWNILNNKEDSEECVNDTWLSVWSAIPPDRPSILAAFVGKITRGHAIDCLRKKYAAKRMDMHITYIEQETEIIDKMISHSLDDAIAEKELIRIINEFLRSLSEADRDIFLRRYWYLDKEADIARRHGKTVNGIKMNLHRSRKKLYKILKAEGSLL
ncbi:MAG: sigma-70 family RNA polymerase sigma factor [Eubacteriales bacterium]|nr:sigma-70 family RNA polymerase sigma factor [Eubacteriales bacterium]